MVKSELVIKATAELNEIIEAELAKPDPKPEVAKAILKLKNKTGTKDAKETE